MQDTRPSVVSGDQTKTISVYFDGVLTMLFAGTLDTIVEQIIDLKAQLEG